MDPMRSFVILLALVACGDDGNTPRDAAGDGSSSDAPVDAVELVPSKKFDIAACAQSNTGTRPCTVEVELDPAACANRACDKLVIYFAGGGQTCPQGIIDGYVAMGYVAACVLLFGDAQEAGNYPYNDEAPRVDLSIRGTTSDPLVMAAWTGAKLLISGSSHGATAPVIAMARTTDDDAAGWKGSALTAACFMDGIYDIVALDNLLGTGNAGQPCPPPPQGVLSHARAIGRYYTTDPAAHSCANDTCACDANHAPEIDEDTIVGVAPSAFAITRWKLVECGSALAACTGDVVPAGPIQALCSAIDASPDHACELQALPNTPHGACAPATICATWFDAQ
jgi:hypothetical protein